MLWEMKVKFKVELTDLKLEETFEGETFEDIFEGIKEYAINIAREKFGFIEEKVAAAYIDSISQDSTIKCIQKAVEFYNKYIGKDKQYKTPENLQECFDLAKEIGLIEILEK